MRARCLAAVLLLGLVLRPGVATAHDDPVVTVRVMCDGFNVLDPDAVLGEISDSATLSVDRPVHGPGQVEAWVKDQMDHDLRIEIVDMGAPVRLADGYTLTWTGRFSRQDWRQAGVAARQATNTVVIQNGRIINWQATLTDAVGSGDQSPSAASPAGAAAAAPEPVPGSGFPSLFGIPVTLFIAAGAVLVWVSLMLRKFLR